MAQVTDGMTPCRDGRALGAIVEAAQRNIQDDKGRCRSSKRTGLDELLSQLWLRASVDFSFKQ